MQFLKKSGYILAALGITVAVVLSLIFTVPVLNNFHLGYLRTSSDWTVKILSLMGQGGATGFITTADSGREVIITNGHVCDLAINGTLVALYGRDYYLVQVIKYYQMNDLCAVTAPSTAGRTASIASGFTNGEKSFAIGHPLLEPLSVTDGELSGPVKVSIVVGVNPPEGKCTGPTYEVYDMTGSFLSVLGINTLCIRNLLSEASTIPILPGNSGSAVVNIYGNVIGVAFAANESGVRSYVVPLSDLKQFLGEI